MAKDTGKVNIHGKEYETVASRVQRFRQLHPNYTLETVIVERNETDVVIRALISDDTGRLLATGYAEEQRQSSQINRSSALENCETSAIGRALASFGIGGTEFASADELTHALASQAVSNPARGVGKQQGGQGYASDKQRAYVKKLLDMRGIAKEEQKGYLIQQYGITMPLTVEGASFVIDELQNSGRLQTA